MQQIFTQVILSEHLRQLETQKKITLTFNTEQYMYKIANNINKKYGWFKSRGANPYQSFFYEGLYRYVNFDADFYNLIGASFVTHLKKEHKLNDDIQFRILVCLEVTGNRKVTLYKGIWKMLQEDGLCVDVIQKKEQNVLNINDEVILIGSGLVESTNLQYALKLLKRYNRRSYLIVQNNDDHSNFFVEFTAYCKLVMQNKSSFFYNDDFFAFLCNESSTFIRYGDGDQDFEFALIYPIMSS